MRNNQLTSLVADNCHGYGALSQEDPPSRVLQSSEELPSLLSYRCVQIGRCFLGVLPAESWRSRLAEAIILVSLSTAYLTLNLWHFFPANVTVLEVVNNLTTIGTTLVTYFYSLMWLPYLVPLRQHLLRSAQAIYPKENWNHRVRPLARLLVVFTFVSWIAVSITLSFMFWPVATLMAQIPWVAELGWPIWSLSLGNVIAAVVFAGWWAFFNAFAFETLILHRFVSQSAADDMNAIASDMESFAVTRRGEAARTAAVEYVNLHDHRRDVSQSVVDAVASPMDCVTVPHQGEDARMTAVEDLRQRTAAMEARVLQTNNLVIKNLKQTCRVLLVPFAASIGFHFCDGTAFTAVFWKSPLFDQSLFQDAQYWLGFTLDCASIFLKLAAAAWVSHEADILKEAAGNLYRQAKSISDTELITRTEQLLISITTDHPQLQATICGCHTTWQVAMAFFGTAASIAVPIASFLAKAS